MNDTYKTIQQPSEGIFKDKGSRFIARAYPVESAAEVKEILSDLRKEFHDARHHCYAYRLGEGGENYRVNDDGEPANSAGKPILGQLQSHELTNILIVVIRYFGGILLGVGGLINAYRTAARESLDHARIIEKTFNKSICIKFQYSAMNDVMRLIKESKAEIVSQEFGTDCEINIHIRAGAADQLMNQLNRIDFVESQSNIR
jgi:uncharacterized YigZ family protein